MMYVCNLIVIVTYTITVNRVVTESSIVLVDALLIKSRWLKLVHIRTVQGREYLQIF